MSHDLKQLTNRYNAYILDGIPRLRRLGYNPFQFLEMVQSAGDAVQATKRLLADPRHTSYGFQRLSSSGDWWTASSSLRYFRGSSRCSRTPNAKKPGPA